MSSFAIRRDPNRRVWWIAWSLALLFHALVLIGVQSSHGWAPAPPREFKPAPIQLTFAKPPAAKAAPKAPTQFTELPKDREDQAPKHADFLSNVTSRSRDNVPGGDQSLPHMSGVADAPSVAMHSGQSEPAPSSTPPPQDASKPTGADGKPAPDASKSAALAPTITPSPHYPAPSKLGLPNTSIAPGSSDIRQEEMDNPEGNAEMTGDVSLNTTEWAWAPWIQRFGRRLMRAWSAPPAYSMGVLKEGGWAVVELEIAMSGEVLRMNVLEQQGHPVLTLSATDALKAISPMEPLPANFPEKTLILRVRMIYPRFRPR